jgi:hypothetical protein
MIASALRNKELMRQFEQSLEDERAVSPVSRFARSWRRIGIAILSPMGEDVFRRPCGASSNRRVCAPHSTECRH